MLSRFRGVWLYPSYGLEIGFIDSTSNNSATANLQNSQFNTAPANLFQPAVSSPAVPWQRLLTAEILQLPALTSFLHRLSFRSACHLFRFHFFSSIFDCRFSTNPLQSLPNYSTVISRDSLSYSFSWPGILVIQPRSGPNRKHRFHSYSSTILRLLPAYSFPQERVYWAVA
jgi:hypothetical protein